MQLDDVLSTADIAQDAGMVLTTKLVGEVRCPSGRLVARDPLSGADAPAFNMVVPPGSYEASLRYLFKPASKYTFFDVVALVLRIRAGAASAWALALTPGDPDPDDLVADRVYGFAVDSATAAIMDVGAQRH